MVRKCICFILVIIIVFSILPGCVNNDFEVTNQGDPYVEFSAIDEEVSLVSIAVLDFYEGEKSAKEVYEQYSSKGSPYKQMAFSLNWGIYNIPLEVHIEKMNFEIATDKDFKDAKNIVLVDSKRSVVLKDLYVDTTYFCRLNVLLSNGKSVIGETNFKTKATPRILMADGAYGLRDIGGVKTSNGVKVKQGMVYRGSEIDGVKSERYTLSKEGVDFFVNDLKIATDFDFRGTTEKNAKNVLGETVNHKAYNIYAYSDSLTKDSRDGLKQCFSDLAEESNYPIYMHCSYGKDRTGTVVYLLQILLGVSEKDAYKEWELSALMDGVHFYDGMEDFLEDLNKLEGNSMQEKVVNYLLSIGVTQDEIYSIRKIMLDN